eukprot:TRINITY_DN4744_c0_g1_i2.p1 TRINITY_DN4744_c0_g1~~TRINITY_DN4744_c0_g1_i2.p1  ORF type:complete len:165 (+),score=58.41 TRINITY_DN4744_c0_g1_i2:71-565(+)
MATTMDLTALTTRRSVRKFKADPVPQELMQQILAKAVLAPSAMGKNPWKFYVVSSPEVLDKVNAQTKKPSYGAPTLVFTTLVNPIPGFEMYDTALAHENLCIAAAAFNVGSVILAYNYPTDTTPTLKTILGVPAEEMLMPVGIAMGYPDMHTATPNRQISAVYL